jgi:hypothetical protein
MMRVFVDTSRFPKRLSVIVNSKTMPGLRPEEIRKVCKERHFGRLISFLPQIHSTL